MTALLLTPMSPQVPGNGLAQRAAMWAEVLGDDDPAQIVVVPVAGPVGAAGGEHVVMPSPRERDDVPALARGIDRRTGRLAATAIAAAAGIESVDVIVCLRSYLGRAALGLRDVLGGALVVDLDDDDVAFFTAAGEPEEAARFARLVDALRQEADVLVSAGGVAGTVVVPNSVLVPDAPHRTPTAPLVAMVGNMGYGPNRDGAAWFVDAVLPRIGAAMPDVTVRIAGPGSEQFGAHGAGFVEDLSDLYATASLVVAPVLIGSGTRTKIIEAWAHAVPVVSTTVGAADLGGVDAEHLLLADDAATFADAVVSLLRDTAAAERLGTAGHALAHSRFDRRRVVDEARTLLGALTVGLALVPATELHVVETDEGLVVLDIASGDVHDLDANAAVVFSAIDGITDLDTVAATIAEAFELATPPVGLVADAVQHLLAAGLVVQTRRPPSG